MPPQSCLPPPPPPPRELLTTAPRFTVWGQMWHLATVIPPPPWPRVLACVFAKCSLSACPALCLPSHGRTGDSSEGTVIVMVQGFGLQHGPTQGGEARQTLEQAFQLGRKCGQCVGPVARSGLLNYCGEEHPTGTTPSLPPSCFERFSGTPHYFTLRI